MAFNIFKKKDESKTKASDKLVVEVDEKKNEEKKPLGVQISSSEAILLKSFYISEKANNLINLNQYVFRVAKNANKPELKKQIERSYKVKVSRINVVNVPRKSRNVGRYSGYKTGYKKAIVTLREGYTISGAKP